MEKSDLRDICYKKNFLTDVIARVDLASPIVSIERELTKDILKTILEEFPIAEPKAKVIREILASKNQLSTQTKDVTEWNFYGKNREKRLIVDSKTIVINYKKFDKFEVFLNDCTKVMNSFFLLYPEAQPSRIGLRFINQITTSGDNPLEWNDFISNDLLHLISYSIEGALPSRLFHNLEFVFPTFYLNFQSGISNPDYPSPIQARQFILDFDVHNKGLIDPKEIHDILDSYHIQIQKLFEKSITSKLREIMDT